MRFRFFYCGQSSHFRSATCTPPLTEIRSLEAPLKWVALQLDSVGLDGILIQETGWDDFQDVWAAEKTPKRKPRVHPVSNEERERSNTSGCPFFPSEIGRVAFDWPVPRELALWKRMRRLPGRALPQATLLIFALNILVFRFPVSGRFFSVARFTGDPW